MMADEVVIRFVTDTKNNEFIRSINQNVDKAVKTGTGFFGKAFKGIQDFMGSSLGKFLGIAGILYMIYDSSKMLQAVVKGLFAVFKAIVGQIVDMIAMVFLPLVYILRPLALMLRIFMLPYRKKMMEAIKLGNQYYKLWIQSGKSVSDYLNKAIESWALAVGWAFKPLFDLLMYGFQYLFQGILDGMSYLIEFVFGWIPGIHDKMKAFRDAVNTGVTAMFQGIRDSTTNAMTNIQSGLSDSLIKAKTMLESNVNPVKKTLEDVKWYNPFELQINKAQSLVSNSTSTILKKANDLDNWGKGGRSTSEWVNDIMHGRTFPMIFGQIPLGTNPQNYTSIDPLAEFQYSRGSGADNSGS